MADLAESNSPLARRNVAVVRCHVQHPEWTQTQIAEHVRGMDHGMPVDARRVGHILAGYRNALEHDPQFAAQLAGTEVQR
jgi:hypothetical protein